MNQRSQDYGRGSRQTDHIDYHRGMIVLHQQYNQILNMLGQSNIQGGTEAAPTSHSANLAQDNHSSAATTSFDESHPDIIEPVVPLAPPVDVPEVVHVVSDVRRSQRTTKAP
ncbi:hypothetical protein H5410_011720 [Solanum commersonii]|uniref:Uncharacterized protein n=1 Tax=Solanum commersonii TaxID=4109 RepID=A0A9J6APH9_SOLCO|nr:hypothetical protein H5410_011720 [Solanum commersonii]